MWAKVNLPEVNARKGRGGPQHPNYKPIGWKYVTPEPHGYVRVKIADHKWEYEHRLVAKTPAKQDTHHKNRIKTDNSPGNLVPMNHSDHLALHRREASATK